LSTDPQRVPVFLSTPLTFRAGFSSSKYRYWTSKTWELLPSKPFFKTSSAAIAQFSESITFERGKDPDPCSPQANFRLTSETLSYSYMRH